MFFNCGNTLRRTFTKKLISIVYIFSILALILPNYKLVLASPKLLGQTALEDDLEKVSEKLFREAKRQYDLGEYWSCARDLIILMDFYSRFSQIDDAIVTLGECLYEMELLEGASRMFKHLVKKYPRSQFIPRALLGLQKIEYEKSDFVRCVEFHKVIQGGGASQEVLDGSRYFAGLSNYYLNDYSAAVSLLSKVDENSDYYDYALYSAALSLLRMGSLRRGALVLRRLISLPVTSPARRKVIDEGYLTLGYLYYEVGRHRHALRYFGSVSSGHENYVDALLGAGWAAVKMEAFVEAIPPLTKLVKKYPTDKNTEEAFFLLGRCYLKLGFYDEAAQVYEYLIELFPTEDVIPAIIREAYASLQKEEYKIEQMKMELLVLESKLLDAIPMGGNNDMPSYIKKESERLSEIREGLMSRINNERQLFHQIVSTLQELRTLAATKESRRDWRAYAEYGKSRALFLKRTQ